MNLSIYLPQLMLTKVKKAAEKEERSVSQFIRMAVANKLKETK